MMKILTTLRVLLTLPMVMLMLQAHAAPINETGTELMKVQFVLLGSSNTNDLQTEKWDSTPEKRASALAEINRLYNSSTLSPTDYPRQLLSQLNRLTDSGAFKILYATQWTQPSTQKRNKIKIEAALNNFPPYNMAFGELQIFERSALISKLNMTIVDKESLNSDSIEPLSDTSGSINVNDGFMSANALASQELEAMESGDNDVTPIIYIEQQRQIRSGQILYFDHPVTPAFMLVTQIQE